MLFLTLFNSVFFMFKISQLFTVHSLDRKEFRYTYVGPFRMPYAWFLRYIISLYIELVIFLAVYDNRVITYLYE